MIIPWRVDVPQERYPYMNWLICIAAVFIFALQVYLAFNVPPDTETQNEEFRLIMEKANNPDMTDEEYIHRLREIRREGMKNGPTGPYVLSGFSFKGLFGHMWLHGGPIHLIGNLLFLWVFGNAVCAKIGNLTFLPIYIFLGIVAGVSHLLFVGGPVIGASGAINGVVGMYLVFFYQNDITCYFNFTIRYWREFTVSSIWIILYFLLFDIIGAAFNIAGSDTRVAYFAHIGGFAAGVTVAIVMLKTGIVKMEQYEKSLLQGWAEKRNPPKQDPLSNYYGSFAVELNNQNPSKPAPAVTGSKPLPFQPNGISDFITPAAPPPKPIELPDFMEPAMPPRQTPSKPGPAVTGSKPLPFQTNGISDFLTPAPPPKPIELPDFMEPAIPPQKTAAINNTPPKPEMIRFMCACGKKVKVPKKYAGKKGTCPKCKNKIQIPNE